MNVGKKNFFELLKKVTSLDGVGLAGTVSIKSGLTGN